MALALALVCRQPQGCGVFGLSKIALMLAGSNAKAVSTTRLHGLPTHGLLRLLGHVGCKELLAELLGQGMIQEQVQSPATQSGFCASRSQVVHACCSQLLLATVGKPCSWW